MLRPRLTRRARLALLLASAPIGAAGLGLASLLGDRSGDLGVAILGVGAVLGLAGGFLGIAGVAGLLAVPAPLRPAGLLAAVFSIPLGLFTGTMGALLTLLASSSFGRGRQVRRFGRLTFAPLVPQSPWVASPPELEEGGPLPAVAAAWRQNGLTEHASVAAFARVSMELVALGAPPALIEDAHRDALDELRHTELCFGLAARFDGRTEGPADFPGAALAMARGPRAVRLAHLAVTSLTDGAINEGLSARVVAELARAVEHREVARVLAAIAKDEARHAAHGFAVMRWCLEAGGRPVAAALEAALAALPEVPGRSLDHLGDDGRFERYGLPGRARVERAHRVVRAKVTARTRRLLAAARGAA